MKTPLTYALQQERLVSIHDVPPGLACACRCPACLQPLIARKGMKMIHHFAHKNNEDCPFAAETMLHRLAKEVLAQEKKLQLPALQAGAYPAPLFSSPLFSFERVWLEHRFHDIIPDLFVQCGLKKLFIEISCTHPCSAAKRKKIAALGIPALEIDLFSVLAHQKKSGVLTDVHMFRQQLIFSQENRRWLFNPKKNALEVDLQKRCERKIVQSIGKGPKATLCVYPCPEQKRRWRQGALKGQTYAQVFRDCLHCPYCLKIDYSEEMRAYEWIPVQPERVFCWAKEKEWIEQFLPTSNS